MKRKILLCCIALLPLALVAQVPAIWQTTGIGGGNPFWGPSINPADSNEYYLSSELSEQFHTLNFGASYSIVDFRQLEGGQNGTVCFTNDPNTRYSINYANNLAFPAKTTDGGTTWNTFVISAYGQTDSSDAFGIWAGYNNPNWVIVATANVVYFSNDGGMSFSLAHFNFNNNIGLIVGGAFFDGNNIYVGTNDGLLESSNGGSSFAIMPTTGILQGESIASFAAAREGSALRFFCLTGDSTSLYPGITGMDYSGFLKNIYLMDNNSGTWVQSMNGINPFTDYLMFVAMAENDTGTAYLGGSDVSNDPLGEPNIMQTTDGGMTWNHIFNTQDNQNIFTGWCGDSADYPWSLAQSVLGLTVDARNKNIVLFTDFNEVMKTNNAGVTWQQGYVNAADQHDSAAATPTRQYYHSVGLENTSCWSLYWHDPDNLFAGYSDIFGIRSKDGGNSWAYDYTSTAPSTNTIYCVTKNISNGTLYAATSSVADLYKNYVLLDAEIDYKTGQIIYSTDTGATWNVLYDFKHPVYWIATDPNDSNRLYASVVNYVSLKGGIWVTNNLSAGASSVWTKLSAAPTTQGHPATINVLKTGKVLCTYSGRENPSTGLLVLSSGVFLYNPDSSSWQNKTATGERYWCHDIIVDQNDTSQKTWYCGVYSGFGGVGEGLGGLYKTTNGGNSWTRIFSGGDVSSCTINPKNGNEMFVTTNGNGLWYSYNINSSTPTFTQAASYLFSAPERVFFNPYDETKMWIASYGNGLQWADKITTGIAESTISSGQFNLYPNPATENVVLNVGEKISQGAMLSENVKIFDLTGRELNAGVTPDGNNILIDVSNLPSGLYIVQLKLNDRVLAGKLVKQ